MILHVIDVLKHFVISIKKNFPNARISVTSFLKEHSCTSDVDPADDRQF